MGDLKMVRNKWVADKIPAIAGTGIELFLFIDVD